MMTILTTTAHGENFYNKKAGYFPPETIFTTLSCQRQDQKPTDTV